MTATDTSRPANVVRLEVTEDDMLRVGILSEDGTGYLVVLAPILGVRS